MKYFRDQMVAGLKKHLEHDEEIKGYIYGTFQKVLLDNPTSVKGIFAATNKRMLFYTQNFSGFNIEIFMYGSISNVTYGKSMWGSTISFHAKDGEYKIAASYGENIEDVRKYAKTRVNVQKASDQPSASNQKASGQPSELDEISIKAAKMEKLVEFRDRGIITEEEFTAKKRQILGL